MRFHPRFPSSLLPSVALVVLAAPNNARAQQSIPQMEQPIVNWTNYYRQRLGLQPVTPNPQLSYMARLHAWHMAAREEMAHELNGSTLVDRARRAGYVYQAVGENVAYNEGYPDPAWKCFDGWMRSPSHWHNIIGPQYAEIGVGVYRSQSGKYYACQVFGTPLGSSPPPALVAGGSVRGRSPMYNSVPMFTGYSRQSGSPLMASPPAPGGYSLEVPAGANQAGRHVGFSPNYEIADIEFYPYTEYGTPSPSWMQH